MKTIVYLIVTIINVILHNTQEIDTNTFWIVSVIAVLWYMSEIHKKGG